MSVVLRRGASGAPHHRAVVLMARVLAVIGVSLMAFSWYGASDTVRVERQVEWATLGLAGASAVSFGMILWCFVARRTVQARLGRLASVIGDTGSRPARSASGSTLRPDGLTTDRFVASQVMVRYHRATCPLVAGKPTGSGTRMEHEDAGRKPCGVCEP